MNFEKNGLKWIHIDIMDGKFVPNITFGQNIIDIIKKNSNLLIDCHLMVENQEKYIEVFKKAGADLITVHVEPNLHIHRTIQKIKKLECKVGIALNPATSLSTLDWILEDIDLVLLMSVNPGFKGQKFINFTLEKIRKLKRIVNEKKTNVKIQVDGGICKENIKKIKEAGADIFVVGSGIFFSNNYIENYLELVSYIL